MKRLGILQIVILSVVQALLYLSFDWCNENGINQIY